MTSMMLLSGYKRKWKHCEYMAALKYNTIKHMNKYELNTKWAKLPENRIKNRKKNSWQNKIINKIYFISNGVVWKILNYINQQMVQ